MQWLCLSLVVVRCQPLRRALGQEYFRVEYVDRNNQGSSVA
ncbi:C4-dicarboxylate ABC transporter [Vibrio cholerae]|nr:C4-dicarboxylate ABC transporter [Vibrio cholerae]BAP04547.1 hypothetical protein MS6_A0288 [Vibrio cholerae MS6]MVC24781.1 C4-dicarboxylate ABC transporter [Vibrio cholerae]MVC32234.1 C4-dicarboxylate ABC transporter [Vibrio cholerae]MVC65684.1 C4-dicarboxylate ABC transporter [Vibrio cholerae]